MRNDTPSILFERLKMAHNENKNEKEESESEDEQSSEEEDNIPKVVSSIFKDAYE